MARPRRARTRRSILVLKGTRWRMSSPSAFIDWCRRELRAAGVRFAITSGQACVHFGIQQTTKDSDWIIEPDDLSLLRSMLAKAESSGEFRVSYRAICGTPLDRAYLGNGWTSHLAMTDPDADEHHLDFFGNAPRVRELERDPVDPDYASRLLVAQMKKTDREKDWPFVFALGRQAMAMGDVRGVLHGQEADWLIDAWSQVPEKIRVELIRQRPLLGLIDTEPRQLRRAIVIEKQVWVSINRERYGVYQRSWKEFYRQWRREPGFQWPRRIPFLEQHAQLDEAAERYALPKRPLDESARRAALATARADAAEILAASDEELESSVPPLEVLLP
ncbi:MAG: hypothetical protein ACC628_05335 [Pirellulaceae bacterium]